MQYIILDMEWNQPWPGSYSAKKALPSPMRGEIVQIGAVRMTQEQQVADEFQILIRPKYFKKMNRKVASLTGIRDSVLREHGIPFAEAIEQFRAWCGEDITILTWGFDDITILRENLAVFGLESGWTARWYNAQLIFNAQTDGATSQRALKTALELMGIEPSRPAHDALGDAYHTALICSRLRLAEGIEAYGQAAKEHENGSLGKTECWYVLDCPEGASLVVGHNAKTREELKEMIEQGKWSELIREVPVRKGDFIQIDPGTVHAIKGGLMILETQQNSDITYRVYDYDRLTDGKPRQLHVKQSIDVINVPAPSAENSVKHMLDLPKNTLNELISCDYYTVWKLEVTEPVQIDQKHPFMNVSVIEGEGLVNGQLVKKGDHFILPSGIGQVDLRGQMLLIASAVK